MTLHKVASITDPHVDAKHVFKFGFNDAVGATAETVWLQGAAYNWISTASVMQVSSTSAEDGVAGDGALTIVIEGLDANHDEISETVTMNGLAQVATSGTYLRVHRAYVATAGVTGVNEGVIYVYTGGVEVDGTPSTVTQIYTTIGALAGQTLQALYTVPAGHTAYIYAFQCSSFGNSNNYATVDLRFREDGGPWRVQDRVVVSRGVVRIPHDIPLKYNEKSDIEVIGASDGSTVDLSASFDLILDIN